MAVTGNAASYARGRAKLSPRDMEHLKLPDDQFKPLTWEEACDIIESGQVDRFRRSPSDLAKYFAHKTDILDHYETIEKYILAEKLRWIDPPATHSTIPYTDSRDYQIRLNDHPYAFTPDICHIVVWSALRFPSNIGNDERIRIYNQFIETHFDEIPKERILWFVNWGALQSVPGLEHFHVLLRNLDVSMFNESRTLRIDAKTMRLITLDTMIEKSTDI